MTATCDDDFLDGAFDVLKNYAKYMYICSDHPTNYTEATVTYALADVTMDSWDYTYEAGIVSGRRCVIANKPLLIDTNGVATHIALVGTPANGHVYYVTTLTPKTVVAGEFKTVLSWSIEIRDPIIT